MVISEHDTQVGGARIHWRETGNGPTTFLLIHGIGSGASKWLDVMPLLASTGRVIAIDLPGFGSSSAPRASYSPAWLAGGVCAFMNAIGLERAVIVGNSLGGLVATHFAAAWPERCEALVLSAPSFPNDGPPPSRRVLLALMAPAIPGLGALLVSRYWRRDPVVQARESIDRNCVDPARVSETVRIALEDELRLRASDPALRRSALATQRRMLSAVTARREATWRALRAVSVPLLLLWGSDDQLVPLHVGQAAVAQVPGAHLVVLDGCGHNPQMESPSDFAGAVIAFARAENARP